MRQRQSGISGNLRYGFGRFNRRNSGINAFPLGNVGDPSPQGPAGATPNLASAPARWGSRWSRPHGRNAWPRPWGQHIGSPAFVPLASVPPQSTPDGASSSSWRSASDVEKISGHASLGTLTPSLYPVLLLVWCIVASPKTCLLGYLAPGCSYPVTGPRRRSSPKRGFFAIMYFLLL